MDILPWIQQFCTSKKLGPFCNPRNSTKLAKNRFLRNPAYSKKTSHFSENRIIFRRILCYLFRYLLRGSNLEIVVVITLKLRPGMFYQLVFLERQTIPWLKPPEPATTSNLQNHSCVIRNKTNSPAFCCLTLVCPPFPPSPLPPPPFPPSPLPPSPPPKLWYEISTQITIRCG